MCLNDAFGEQAQRNLEFTLPAYLQILGCMATAICLLELTSWVASYSEQFADLDRPNTKIAGRGSHDTSPIGTENINVPEMLRNNPGKKKYDREIIIGSESKGFLISARSLLNFQLGMFQDPGQPIAMEE
jgi:hypothetical protein